MTPFDLNFYYKKTEEMLKAQKEQMQQAYKQQWGNFYMENKLAYDEECDLIKPETLKVFIKKELGQLLVAVLLNESIKRLQMINLLGNNNEQAMLDIAGQL